MDLLYSINMSIGIYFLILLLEALTIVRAAQEFRKFVLLNSCCVCMLLSTVKRQKNFLQVKYGCIEDEMHDDEEDDKEGKNIHFAVG